MASNDDERRPTLPTSTSTVVTRQQSRERARAAFDALPNDVIVSIFQLLIEEPAETAQALPWWEQEEHLRSFERRCSDDRRWVRETFPLVCRRWRDLYRSQQASPLHETLDVDSGRAGARRVLRPERVIAWATTHARDVRTLRVDGGNGFGDFTSENLGTLVEILAPSLTAIEAGENTSSLTRGRFWDALREHVAPRGQLRKLAAAEIAGNLAEGGAVVRGDVDVSFLGQLTSLEELRLDAYSKDRRVGLRAFPASLLSLTGLRRLCLSRHVGIASLPPGISTLRGLEDLDMALCGLSSLPEELGELTRLTRLFVAGNYGFERPARDELDDIVFPNALRRLKSLRHLVLSFCRLRAVPAFVGELRALEHLDLVYNEGLGDGAPWAPFAEPSPLTYLDLSYCRLTSVPAAVLSSMPRLRVLKLRENSVASLPENLGQRLPELREIDLSWNDFETIAPLRALVGASSLEKIDVACGFGSSVQVEEPLDFLLESFPRLREIRMRKFTRTWTPASLAHIERFAERLKERDPAAVVEF